MAAPPALDIATSADNVVTYVDAVRRTPALRETLVGLLDERSPIYAGLGTGVVERLRGYLLATFEVIGLPPTAMSYVLEELETGRNPYTVAAAAKAVRGANPIPAEVLPLLLAAIGRIRLADDRVSFDTFSPGPGWGPPNTALMELFRTMAWLGPGARPALNDLKVMLGLHSDSFSPAVREEIRKAVDAVSLPAPTMAGSCCVQAAAAKHAAESPPLRSPDDLRDLELQDQDGAVLTFGEASLGRTSVVTFFYTRCVNPEKCSLTITKLARLQRRIADGGFQDQLNLAGITYDPGFDRPERLRAYGVDRGMVFNGRNRLLRTTGPFEVLQQHFDLGVGFGPVTVNRHRVDLVVLDGGGHVAVAYTHRLWSENEVLDALRACHQLTS